MPVQFAKLTPKEHAALVKIVDRAVDMFRRHDTPRDRIDIVMDLEVTHATCPLRLEELVEAGDFDFAHDIYGITRHLNRETGELENCFLPRFALPPEKGTGPEMDPFVGGYVVVFTGTEVEARDVARRVEDIEIPETDVDLLSAGTDWSVIVTPRCAAQAKEALYRQGFIGARQVGRLTTTDTHNRTRRGS